MAEKEIQQLGEMLQHYLIDLVTTALRESKEQGSPRRSDTEQLLHERDGAYSVIAALCLREPDASITLTPLDTMRVPRGFMLIEERALGGERTIRVVSPSSGVATLTQIEAAREEHR